jgi:hypothetical protein
MPNYVCVTVCLVVKTIVVWESNKLPCCWHDLQTLESEAMGHENGYSYTLVQYCKHVHPECIKHDL